MDNFFTGIRNSCAISHAWVNARFQNSEKIVHIPFVPIFFSFNDILLQGKILAAVCAAPTAFQSHDIGKGKSVTSYPAFKEKLEGDYKYSEDRVVVDGNLVTSRGPGTCFEFGFKLAELLVDKEMADQLKSQTLALTS